MNDLKLLQDIDNLQSKINNVFRPLIAEANQIKIGVENVNEEINLKYQYHQNIFNQVEELSDRLHEIGGGDQFLILLGQINTANQLLCQYSDLNQQVEQSLDQYNNLQQPLEVQIQRSSTAKDDLIAAYKQVEELRNFCNELISVRELLTNIGGSSGLYASMTEVTNLISHFNNEWQSLEVNSSEIFNKGEALLQQLRTSQESALKFLAIHQDLERKITSLEEFINSHTVNLANTNNKLDTLSNNLSNFQEQVNGLNQEFNSKNQSINQNFTSVQEKLKELDSSLNNQGDILGNIHSSVAELNGKSNNVQTKVEELESLIDSQEKLLTNTQSDLANTQYQLSKLDQEIQSQDLTIQLVSHKFAELELAVNNKDTNLELRMEKLNNELYSSTIELNSTKQTIKKLTKYKTLIGFFALGLIGGVIGSVATLFIVQCFVPSVGQSQICRVNQ